MSGARRADALVAAAETLDALQIDQSCVIDPFAAIADLGLTLSIAKLGNLLGAVVPRGTGGVLITSERSPAIQRYTAAHEIGHWILHEQQLQVDGETEVLGRPSTALEREAQVFAGYFLMPPALLNSAVSAYGLRPGHIAPEEVYRLSRDLDVSYEAAARRLHTDRLISDAGLLEILEVGRMKAMQRASAGHRPADGLADVWDASSDEDVVSLVVEESDEVLVALPEQRLAGWRWFTDRELAGRNRALAEPAARPRVPPGDVGSPNLAPEPASEVLQAAAGFEASRIPSVATESPAATVVGDVYAPSIELETDAQRRRRRVKRAGHRPYSAPSVEPVAPRAGGSGVRRIVVRASTPGDWRLRLYYAHAYDPRRDPLLTYELQLVVQPTPNTAFRIQRLSSDLDLHLPGDPDDDTEFEVA